VTPTTVACPKCGAAVNAGARFCASCGTDVSPEQARISTAEVVELSPPVVLEDPLLERLRDATLGEYDVSGELGRGGMAAVYLAHEIALDRQVAIKVMLPDLVHGAGMVERFKREAKTAGALSHPNIIPIYAVRETEGLLYFVMKFVEGRPLDSVIKELGRLPIAMAQTILAQVGGALAYAHRRGVVHRDVKPANIMIDEEGWAVVTDFGIAKVETAEGLTMTGATIGTPYYMSPEQCSSKGVTGQSDQYSLGIVAFEMLTGKPPFNGDSMMAIMRAQFMDAVPDLGSIRSDCPPALAAAVARMVEKEPEKRWPSLDDAVAAIGAATLAHDDPIRTQMVTLARSGKRPRLSVPISPAPAGRARTRATGSARRGSPAPRRRKGIWLGGIGVAAAIAVAVTALVLKSRAPSVGALKSGPAAGSPSAPAATQPSPAPIESAAPAGAAGQAPAQRIQAPSPNAQRGRASAAVSRAAARPAPQSAEPKPEVSAKQTAAPLPQVKVTDIRPDSVRAGGAVAPETPTAATAAPEARPAAVVAQPPTPAVPETGRVVFGTRADGVVYYVNGSPRGVLRGLVTLPFPAGAQVRLSIRAEGCAPWDSTVTITPGVVRLGYRGPKCGGNR
jgi:serine/threonine protein kinase